MRNTQTTTRRNDERRRITRHVEPFCVGPNFPKGWNKKPLTEADLLRACARAGITVREVAIETPAYYIARERDPHIYFNTALRGSERLRTLMQMLGHHLLHEPGEQLRRGRRTAVQIEAAAFAACALIPRTLLDGRSLRTIARQLRCPLSLVEFRAEVFNRWDI